MVERLIERVTTKGNTEYRINNVSFNLEWFNKIRKDELTADEVFAIDNVEHRRIAYEMMDKTKMSALKDFKVLDEKIDNHGLKMRVVSFNVQNMKEDLLFYNCFCPTTKREYYLGTSEIPAPVFGARGLHRRGTRALCGVRPGLCVHVARAARAGNPPAGLQAQARQPPLS